MSDSTVKEEGFVRDEHSTAILCADIRKRETFMRKRASEQRIKKLEEGFIDIKNDISEIKILLQECLIKEPK